MRLGDCVINWKDVESLTFQIVRFDGDMAMLKVVGLPVTTFLPIDCLVKISATRPTLPFRVLRGGAGNYV